jgi:hypothetical protein
VSELLAASRTILLAITPLLIAGCDTSSPPDDRSTGFQRKTAGRENVTFYIAGMNERLKIY